MFLFLFSSKLFYAFLRLKELFQVKNGSTTQLQFFVLKMPKIWVGRTKLNAGKKEDGLVPMNVKFFQSWGRLSRLLEN